ncbi:hypothetical protein [Companilactobacillus hulinensis]|uniref:hypothetical protein n=1 Tax=Companilactobacillus hulinensis TaxID=2486007 RepID=UPI000F790659|nr:hypothetical protein [Companilactobacillus hulinensis]
MENKSTLPQLLAWQIMIVVNSAVILYVIRTFNNYSLVYFLPRTLIWGIIGLVLFVGYMLIQAIIGFSIHNLNDGNGAWAVVLLLAGFVSPLYIIPAVWALIMKYVFKKG